jgi:hypothetical protein
MNTPTVQTIVAVGAAIVIVGYLARQQIAGAVTAVTEINEGTDFEGAGIVGVVGNVTDKASGGLLSNIGSSIGEFFSGSFFDKRTIDDLTGT